MAKKILFIGKKSICIKICVRWSILSLYAYQSFHLVPCIPAYLTITESRYLPDKAFYSATAWRLSRPLIFGFFQIKSALFFCVLELFLKLSD